MEERIEIPDSDEPQMAYEMKMKNYRRYRLVFFLLGLIEVLLVLRFVFKLFGANGANVFAMIIYGVTSLLLLPFSGLFGKTVAAVEVTARVFEPSTLIAMIVYALIAWGASKLILIFKSKPKTKTD